MRSIKAYRSSRDRYATISNVLLEVCSGKNRYVSGLYPEKYTVSFEENYRDLYQVLPTNFQFEDMTCSAFGQMQPGLSYTPFPRYHLALSCGLYAVDEAPTHEDVSFCRTTFDAIAHAKKASLKEGGPDSNILISAKYASLPEYAKKVFKYSRLLLVKGAELAREAVRIDSEDLLCDAKLTMKCAFDLQRHIFAHVQRNKSIYGDQGSVRKSQKATSASVFAKACTETLNTHIPTLQKHRNRGHGWAKAFYVMTCGIGLGLAMLIRGVVKGKWNTSMPFCSTERERIAQHAQDTVSAIAAA